MAFALLAQGWEGNLRMKAIRNHAGKQSNEAEAAVHDLVGLLYEAAVDCRRWPAFLERLVVLTDKGFASLVTREFGVEAATPGVILLRRIPPQNPHFDELYLVLGMHMRRALELQRRVRDLEAQQLALKVAVDHFSTGLVLLDPQLRMRFMNASARTILSRSDGLWLRNGLLIAERREDNALLSRTLQKVLHDHESRPNVRRDTAMVWIARSSGKRPLGVVICPTDPEHPLSMMSALAVYVSDSESGILPDGETLSLLYRFTPAETGITLQLLEGKSLEEGARELHISLNTARTHLKRVLQKTDTSRQSDLIRQLLTGPASLRL